MPTSGESAGAAKSEKAAGESAYAIFFELEGVALNGRRAAFESLKSALNDHHIKLNAGQFGRHCLHPSPAHYLPGLLEALGARKLSVEKLAEEVLEGMVENLTSSRAGIRPGLLPLLEAGKERNITLVAATALPEPAAQAVSEKLGLEKRGVRLFNCQKEMDESFPRSDTWLKAAKTIHRPPRRCLVLVSSAVACRAALTAGMRCVAVPDEFTQHQDFGGADLILDTLEGVPVDELLFPIGAPSL